MAMIFQTFALYPHLSTFDNLAYPLREQRHRGGEMRRRVGEIAEMLGIGHTLARRPTTLSGGEQQRVAIGRALIRRPKLLLLDEPLTNLDAKLRHDTRAEFKRLHRELGMTMVYATPDQLEALTMGERIAVLRDGRIVQTGTPASSTSARRQLRRDHGRRAADEPACPGTVRDRAGGIVVELPFGEVDAARWAARARLRAPRCCSASGRTTWRPARADRDGPRFAATVHLTEPLGDVTVIDLEAGGAVLKMALPEEEALAYRPAASSRSSCRSPTLICSTGRAGALT